MQPTYSDAHCELLQAIFHHLNKFQSIELTCHGIYWVWTDNIWDIRKYVGRHANEQTEGPLRASVTNQCLNELVVKITVIEASKLELPLKFMRSEGLCLG